MGTTAIAQMSLATVTDQKKQRQRASKSLSNARQRCTNPKDKDYANYGAQGIKVLITLDGLIAAIGLPPLKASLDRVDPHGHYEAGNVRWASKAVQAANKKSSPAGSIAPLHTLIAQQKFIVEEEQRRFKVAEAWQLLSKAFNCGTSSETANARLIELLEIKHSAREIFGSREMIVAGEKRTIFRFPALTFPQGIVDARGPLQPAPDDERARKYLHHGLLFGLRDLESPTNIPDLLRTAINQLLHNHDRPGLALVGRPSGGDLTSGWFEIWMLAAASRLVTCDVRPAFFPAMTCVQLLKDIGGPSNWDQNHHPLLDARLLFIPDFQLDCGPWGHLSPHQFGMLERLLRYRTEMSQQTVVGVQAPHKLSVPLQKIILGAFRVEPIANGTRPSIM